jgi:TetR/AcrR family transcriptional regulator, transcriptional repressor for nem operon
MTIVIYTSLMGHSQKEKEKSHRQIVKIAAARMRESGTDGPGVAEIMAAAGLTHGGFYKHFDSRDDLVAEAVEAAIAEGEVGYREATAGAADPLAAFVDWYLSDNHRDNPGSGCAVVALGADAAHGSEPLRAAYADQVRGFVKTLAQLRDASGDAEADRRRATTAMSALVGALLTARAVDDPQLSEQILRDVRTELLDGDAPAA